MTDGADTTRVRPQAACPPGGGGGVSADAPKTGERLELNVTSDPANLAPVRRACEAFAACCGLGEAAVGDVGLVVNEVMANVTRHAYGGATDRPVRVTAERTADGLRLTVRDWGTGVNPASLPPKPRDPAQPGGLGLICLRQLMDDVAFAPQPDGMLLTMVKRK